MIGAGYLQTGCSSLRTRSLLSGLIRLSSWSGLGALVGLAWGTSTSVGPLIALLTIPFAYSFLEARRERAALLFGYFCSGIRGLPVGAVVFFGDQAPSWLGWVFWALASILLTAPFICFTTNSLKFRGFHFGAAILALTLSPIALIGWVSPLAVAGVLFPNLAWGGILLTLLLLIALASRSWRVIGILIALAMLCNAVRFSVSTVPKDSWVGVDTTFPRLSSAGADNPGQVLAGMQRAEWLKAWERTVPAGTVAVLPETILGQYDGVAQFSLQDTEASLRAKGSRILVGAEIPLDDGRYKNAVLVLGAQSGDGAMAVQTVPVPVSMWRPWAREGAIANVFGHENVISVGGKNVGVIICYEQVLPFSILRVMITKPNVIAAVSNVWWAKDTSIPAIQKQTIVAFARLFGVPVVMARNA